MLKLGSVERAPSAAAVALGIGPTQIRLPLIAAVSDAPEGLRLAVHVGVGVSANGTEMLSTAPDTFADIPAAASAELPLIKAAKVAAIVSIVSVACTE